MNKAGLAACVTIVLAVLSHGAFQYLRTAHLPPQHLQGHPVLIENEILDERVADELMLLMLTLKEFKTHAADTSYYKTRREHIGEAQPLVNGSCAHPFLVPASDRSACVLPGRIDVARAYVASGGTEGRKEALPLLLSRVQSFGRYHFNISEFPVVENLFSSSKFQRLAKSVCPPQQQVLDPFQFNFIANIPGQTVASHIDAPYFFGADRFHVPQWLLAVMVFSGLFQPEFVHQVQVVAYIHRWQDPLGTAGGDFVFWDDASGTLKRIRSTPRSGSGVDGSKTVHAATVFRPNVHPPFLDKSKSTVLRFEEASGADSGSLEDSRGRWSVSSDGRELQAYNTSDLRFSVVYRARCFADDAARERFAQQRREGGPSGDGDMIPLDTILRRLTDGLVARGAVTQERVSQLAPIDLAFLLIDSYVKYPLAGSDLAFVPLNYCAAKMLPNVPSLLHSVLDAVCETHSK